MCSTPRCRRTSTRAGSAVVELLECRVFEDDPWLGLDLFGIERPCAGTPIDRANTLNRQGKRPWQTDPAYPDLVLVLRDPNDPKKGVVLCLEAQRKNRPEKFWKVILYIGLLAFKHKLPVVVMLVSFSRAFSRLARSWARGLMKLEALVLDVGPVKPMKLERARARPTAAVLAAALHDADSDGPRRARHRGEPFQQGAHPGREEPVDARAMGRRGAR